MSLTRSELKRIKSLSTRKGRRQVGQFFAEGVRLLEEAERFDLIPNRVLYDGSTLSERGARLIRCFRRKRVTTTPINSRQLAQISDTRNSQGIIGVFRITKPEPDSLRLPDNRRILWCHKISDPGNLGTLLRSAVAFQFDSVVLSGNCTDAYSPKVIRATAGAIFSLRIVPATLAQMLKLAAEQPYRLLAADSQGEAEVRKLHKPEASHGVILAIGSEPNGLPGEIIDTADGVLRIMHSDMVESLNVAVAGSILMKELYEQFR